MLNPFLSLFAPVVRWFGVWLAAFAQGRESANCALLQQQNQQLRKANEALQQALARDVRPGAIGQRMRRRAKAYERRRRGNAAAIHERPRP